MSTPLPSPQLLEILKACWNGEAFNFVNVSGQLVAFAPLREPEAHTRCLLVDRQIVRGALAERGLELVWTILGQRCVRDTKRDLTDAMDEFSGVYWFEREVLKGGITQHIVRKVHPLR